MNHFESQRKFDFTCINKTGYPFFAGKISAVKEFELTEDECAKISRFTFRCRAFNSVQVIINGIDCGKVFWEPWAVNVPAGVLKAGKNIIELRVVQSLRNMLGPHHMKTAESGCVGTISWNKGENIIGWPPPEPFNPAYSFTACGVEDMYFEGWA